MSDDTRENFTRRSIWLRLVFMIVLGIAFNVTELIIFVVVIFQFLTSLFTGRTNSRLTRFGQNLARYLQQIVVFLTFATDEKPFPFSPWPDEPHRETPMNEDTNQLNNAPESNADTAESDETGKATKQDGTKASENR